MDHRDAFEQTAEPVAGPASAETAHDTLPAHDERPAHDEPSAVESVAQSAAPDSGPTEPAAADVAPPADVAPAASEPIAPEPAQTAAPEVVRTEPVATEPVASEPATSEPATSELVVSETTPSTEATASTEPAGEEAPATAPVDPRRLRAQQAWERVLAAHESGEHVTGTVTAAVKGGLLVDVGGIRGFLPASQVRVTIGTALDTLVKTKLPLKVLDVDNARRRIVVSQRRAVDEERRSKRSELLRSLAVGQTREATVARLTDFGAFVDLGGIDGLIPMRELAFERIDKASDVLTVGDTVTVQVLRIEENGKKIALSRKNALPDPWRDHSASLRNGTTLEGKVVAREPQLIVEIAPGVTGAVRADEVNPSDYEIGEAIEVTVRSVDRVRRRIVLSTLPAATAAAAPQQMQTTSSGFAPLGVELSQRKR